MKQEVIVVQNMKCEGCVDTIAQVLGVFPEVTDLKIDLEAATITITTKSEDQRSKYEATLTKAGYPPVVHHR